MKQKNHSLNPHGSVLLSSWIDSRKQNTQRKKSKTKGKKEMHLFSSKNNEMILRSHL